LPCEPVYKSARSDIGNLYPQGALSFNESLYFVPILSTLQTLGLGNAVGVAESNFAFDRSITLSKVADQSIDGGDLVHKLLSVHGAFSNRNVDARTPPNASVFTGAAVVNRATAAHRLAKNQAL
jgi:hypothetical protein